MAFIQRASDSFTIEVHGPYHCGPDHTSPKQFTFEVELSYPESALDENGFLLDNLYFKRYFDGLGCTELSCEQLCRKAAHDLQLATDNRADRTTVAIWAIPNHARIEYQVRKDWMLSSTVAGGAHA